MALLGYQSWKADKVESGECRQTIRARQGEPHQGRRDALPLPRPTDAAGPQDPRIRLHGDVLTLRD